MIARVNDNDYEVETGSYVAFHVRVECLNGEEEAHNIANTESNSESKPHFYSYYSYTKFTCPYGHTDCNPD
jgi:hypothetical protein